MNTTPGIETAPFGRTGHHSTRTIFGAAAIGSMRQDKADAVLELIRIHSINHIDTAASYGESEDRLKPWLATHRNSVFLATKTGERNGVAARKELERSLERMGTDQIDLIQLHNLVEPDEWETAFAPDGAVAALATARDEGLVRFIGVTGHGVRIPGMHLRSLQRFPFDSVLLPFNFTMMSRPDYRHDVEALLDMCTEQSVAVQTIKSIAKGRWTAESTQPHFSWYEPLSDPHAINNAVNYVMSHPQLFLNTTSDTTKLSTVLNAATGSHIRPSDDAMISDVNAHGITPLFDGAELERI
jgi:aryl-alcohol dehydrogenase-like predicted oxidoreductase